MEITLYRPHLFTNEGNIYWYHINDYYFVSKDDVRAYMDEYGYDVYGIEECTFNTDEIKNKNIKIYNIKDLGKADDTSM